MVLLMDFIIIEMFQEEEQKKQAEIRLKQQEEAEKLFQLRQIEELRWV